MHGERLPELLSSLQGGGKKNLPCVRKKHSTGRLFGFATFQQNAREKACHDCWLQSMPAQRSQVIRADEMCVGGAALAFVVFSATIFHLNNLKKFVIIAKIF